MASDFSEAALQVRRQWNQVFKILKESYIKPKSLFQDQFWILFEGRRKKIFLGQERSHVTFLQQDVLH